MKKPLTLLALCSLILISTTALGQKKGLNVLAKPVILGKNCTDGADIVGVEYSFPDRIDSYFIDTTTKLLTVQIRGLNANNGLKKKGNILQYDPKNEKLLWNKPIDYDVHELLKFDTLLILNEYNDSYGLNVRTGENLWTVRNYIYFANPKYNVGVAYEFLSAGEGRYTNNLFGVDLWKRKILWKRNINRGFGWNDYFYMNDSTLMVVAAGLHTINIKTGEGWDYNAITGKIVKPDNSGAIAGAVIGGIIGGIIGGLIGGMVMVPIYAPLQTGDDVVRDITSNALIDNNSIYFAYKDTIVKLDKESGEIIWKNSFKKDFTSNSSLFIANNIVYMINKGFAFQGTHQISCGKTFIAAYDTQTGEQKYFLLLDDNNVPIRDFKLIDNELYVIFRKAIVKYYIKTGVLISEKILTKKGEEDFNSFVDSNVYIANQNGYFLNSAQYDPTNIHIKTRNTILSFDNQLNAIYSIENDRIWNCYLHYKDYKLIANSQKTLIIDNDGKKIAEIAFSSNALIMDDILYDKRDKRVVAIDLRNLIIF